MVSVTSTFSYKHILCNHDLFDATLQQVLDPGLIVAHTAHSCADIFQNRSDAPSGYYWLRSGNGSAVRVLCDMTLACKGVGGGWMQVAKLDMTNDSHQCPNGTRLRTDLLASHNIRLCGINFDGRGCSSTTFNTHGIGYTQVCGKIIAYQYAATDGFPQCTNVTIDDLYVDGISLTHGRNLRRHIWTFASALSELGNDCLCTNIHQTPSANRYPPTFVGNDYFCDTAVERHWGYTVYTDVPLWDGAA